MESPPQKPAMGSINWYPFAFSFIEYAVKQNVELTVIWDVLTPIWRQYNVYSMLMWCKTAAR